MRGILRAVWHALKRNLAAGLLVTLPAITTLVLVLFLWDLINRPIEFVSNRFALYQENPGALGDGLFDRGVAWLMEHNVDLSVLADVPGLGLYIILALIFLAGMAARSFAGRTVIATGEGIVHRVPIIGSVYAALKQVLEAIISGSSGAFRAAVLIQYPRKGLWSIAFLTSRVPPVSPEQGENEQIFCFVPTTPNPTSGVLVLVNRTDAIPLNITVDEAVKLVISGGIVIPSRGLRAGKSLLGAPAEAARSVRETAATAETRRED
jgi:uncharacterized membrane protein